MDKKEIDIIEQQKQKNIETGHYVKVEIIAGRNINIPYVNYYMHDSSVSEMAAAFVCLEQLLFQLENLYPEVKEYKEKHIKIENSIMYKDN